ncbi:valine--tRNA ligase [Micromonospora haikouensis]|uniref:valine--tRNA ligase n=1 Tax=Micromonospora haikouensis TaxID=686309 RepID=UPI0009E514D5|nr:valine--tRNA ligase [Micromonospora haikouensis]
MDATEYDHLAVETTVRALWEEHDIYRFDRSAVGPVFSIDTPPPYVSASHLHVGHAMSYSQPDFVIRYRRMQGDRIFYPMGFDDNGLPTERYVEKTYGVRAIDMPRSEFVALCLTETRKTAARYEDLWRRVGLSVDWDLLYSTIDKRCQLTAQTSFIKLHEAGHLRRVEDPIIWCTECRTALAQADVEDLDRNGKMHDIAFTAADGRALVIATTRPELLPACVALYFHPADERYGDLLDTQATVPLFGYQVPIRADESVDPAFGTGLMMVCTFGDGEDVLKWRRDGLDLRLVVTPDGRLSELAGQFAGLQLPQARAAIVAQLAEIGALTRSRPLKQNVGVHERCLTPVEYQIRAQWFIRVRDHQDTFLARAKEMTWIPAHMQRRLEDWIEGLKWDWNISRQRHYGVPFPVWFCDDCGHAVTADLSALPVDPLADTPPVDACPACSGRLSPDPDVMDTWMTSSLSPQINDNWAVNGLNSDPQLAPMSLRVQAFEIIRTWLFYTIVQSQYHFDRLPWQTVMISGWGLNEQGKKIAKRDLDRSTTPDGFNRYVPDHVIERYGADALRIWATKARIGTDLRYNEKDVKTGRKFAVKIWNVARLMTLYGFDSHAAPDPAALCTDVDRWMLSHLASAIDETTAAMDEYDFMQGYQAASRFFWSVLCDRYIEMVKERFLNPGNHTDAERASARAALGIGFRAVLGMFAPFAPFVTDYLYQQMFRPHENTVSLHLTSWPAPHPQWRTDRKLIDDMSTILDRIRVLRSGLNLGSNTRIAKVVLHGVTDDGHRTAQALAEPLRVAARADEAVFSDADTDSGVDGIKVAIIA